MAASESVMTSSDPPASEKTNDSTAMAAATIAKIRHNVKNTVCSSGRVGVCCGCWLEP